MKSGAPQWLIQNKIDLLEDRAGQRASAAVRWRPEKDEFEFAFLISAESGQGLDTLFGALAEFAGDYFAVGETAVVTRARHRQALDETTAALERALAEATAPSPREEVIAEELRQATWALGRLTGRVDVEDVLDKIFRDFCIGK